MPWVSVVSVVEMKLSGVWTNVTPDVVYPLKSGSGDLGSGPNDRVPGTGVMTLALENSIVNSAGLLGYYSPNHANKRAGFELGIEVRWSLVYSGATYYKFIGTIDAINPVAGLATAEKLSLVTVVNWMDEAARFRLSGLPTVLSTNAAAVLTQILAAMPKQPNATSIATDTDTYAYAMANGPAERVTALAEFQRLAVSNLGRIYMRGSTSAATAGQFTFYSRQSLVQAPRNVSQATFVDTMSALEVDHSRKAVLNVFNSQVHPRTVDRADGDPVVLFTYAGEPTPIDPGKTIVIIGQYSDPNQAASRVSGYNMIAPVHGTDYRLNSNPDGSGTDLSADFVFVAELGNEGVVYTITNNGAVTGFVAPGPGKSGLQQRGFGIYDYSPLDVETRDAASVTAHGESPVAMDFWYQSDPSFAKNAGDYLLPYWKDPATNAEGVLFESNISDALMIQSLAREPGDLITIQETVTGLNRLFRIQAVDLTLMPGNELNCSWTLTPEVDTTDYWFLEEAGSALGDGTPQSAAPTTTSGTAASATPVVNLPGSIASGDTLLVAFRSAASGAIGWPAGWTELFDDASDASDDQTACAWRKADGTEGATITLSSANAKFAALAWQIIGGADPAVSPPQFSALVTGTSTAPNPGSLAPTGGAKPYLWIAVFGCEGEQAVGTITAPPNYTLYQIAVGSGGADVIETNVRVAGAARELNAASENPGAFGMDTSDDWTAWTIAVHPGAATRVSL